MFKEIIQGLKKQYKTEQEIIRIRKEIENNTREVYEDTIANLYSLSDTIWEKVPEDTRNNIPIINTRKITECNAFEYDEITRTILRTKSSNDDIKYRYAYVDHYNDEKPKIVDLELLTEHFEADNFYVFFNYDQVSPNGDYFFSTMSISTFYDRLKEFRNSRNK